MADMMHPDVDPQETQEWLDSLETVFEEEGAERAHFILEALIDKARRSGAHLPYDATTAYINTIPVVQEPTMPGDQTIEARIRAAIRWNALMIVLRASKKDLDLGGHIGSFASSAMLYDVGFNHFFKAPNDKNSGDFIFYQGHISPGIYARSFLEGNLSETQLNNFRQECDGQGIPSYPHPHLMKDYWQFPTVSMGLGPLQAIYTARFLKYLTNRGIKDCSEQRVYCYLGDGECDEPESLGAIGLASREGLDNLTFVINCNLQRLDGPVRGNGKIIQELESIFGGAGWNVIKVVWGREWDPLLAQDREGALVNLMNKTLDGDYQTFKAESGAYVRENFFGRDPRTAAMVADWSDEKIWGLKRGGHDYKKLFAAYTAATQDNGRPTVILAKTIKGWTLGSSFEGRNSTHQMKKMSLEDIMQFRDTLHLDIPDEKLDKYLPPYLKPAPDSPEALYLAERRAALGGSIPRRRAISRPLTQPDDSVYDSVKRGSGHQEIATTMAFVRMLKDLVKDPGLGARIVPIIPDEARTFGMDSLFPTLKIYSPNGQQYAAVDRDLMLSYKESTTGVILHEGINEAGSVASFTAVGSSYSTHDEPMIPIYIFYSMFGFQRTGDAFWAAADQLVRGFVVGATAGRTTLNGEGLQHEDGHSPLLASTNPAVVAYDPAFAFELGHIVKDGLRRMYGENSENIYYYVTVYNEPYVHPTEPENLDVEGLLKGIYLYSPAAKSRKKSAQILASGVGVNWALKAQQLLADDWGVKASVWSVTSWNELRRDGLETDRHNLLNPKDKKRAYISKKLDGHKGPVIAVSDYMRSVQDQVAPWVDAPFYSLGTDGFGLSDTRGALRRHFKVDAESITVAVLQQLSNQGDIKASIVTKAMEKYRIHDVSAADAGNTEGSG